MNEMKKDTAVNPTDILANMQTMPLARPYRIFRTVIVSK